MPNLCFIHKIFPRYAFRADSFVVLYRTRALDGINGTGQDRVMQSENWDGIGQDFFESYRKEMVYHAVLAIRRASRI